MTPATVATAHPPRHHVSRSHLGGLVLAVAVVILVLRLPGSVMVMAAAPFISLLISGLHRPPVQARLLWLFLACATVSAFVGVFLVPTGLGLVNFATLALTFTMFGLAVLCSGDSRGVAGIIMTTLYGAFGFALVVGLLEMASGFKLQTVLYPDASNLKFAGRFLVAAWFPNYNDFAVVVTMFALMAFTRFLFDNPASRGRRAVRLTSFFAAFAVIVIGGSRGALMGLAVGFALILIHAVRVVRPRLITGLAVILAALIASAGALVIWLSPWVQDNSTALRERIVENTLALTPGDSIQFWVGWGDVARFTDATTAAYPNVLMDPHNVLLEVFIWFGFPTLLALLVLWCYVCWRGLWRAEIQSGWVSTAAVVLFALTPVLGIVPSSSLRYYYLFLIAPCAVALLWPPRERSKELA